MTENKSSTIVGHTPGPWEFDETTLSICRMIVTVEDVQAFDVHPSADSHRAIAYVPCDVQRAEQEANARLIAAAPRVLDALRGMVGLVQLVDRDRPDLQSNHRFIEALAAIAEVEGGQ
jgi:hypothetical protein